MAKRALPLRLNLTKPDQRTIAAILVIGGFAAIGWSLPTIVDTYIVVTASILGGVALIYITTKLRQKEEWARDILIVMTTLMTLLAVLSLASGFSLLWLVIGLLGLYLVWGLLAL